MDGEDPIDASFVHYWKLFLQTSYASRNVPDWFNRLQDAISNEQQDNQENNDEFQQQEEWMIGSNPNVSFSDSSIRQEIDVNWQEDRFMYTDQQIGVMPHWIRDKKDATFEIQRVYEIEIASLNEMQTLAYNMVKTHQNHNEPLRLIVIGEAGTGKSYLINSLRMLLGQKMCCNSNNWKGCI